jgi:hypothetical protein
MTTGSDIRGVIEVTFNTPPTVAAAAASGGPAKVKKPPPSLGLRKKASEKAAGGAAWLGQKTGIGGMASAAKGVVDKKIDPKTQSLAKQSLKNSGAMVKSAGKAAGISVGVASILKQSQLFTGVIGTIFQILGMLVDVIIMPFMPLIIPVIKLLAMMIPPMMAFSMFLQKWIQKGVDLVANIGSTIKNRIVEAAKSFWSMISSHIHWFSGPLHPIKGFFLAIKAVIDVFVDIFKIFYRIVKAAIDGYVWYVKQVLGVVRSVINKIWDFLSPVIGTIKDFFVDKFKSVKSFFIEKWSTVSDILDIVNPMSWIPKIIEKIKELIPGAGDMVPDAVKNMKFWGEGGIVTRPTLGIAGENGPEAIIPLRNLSRMATGGSRGDVNITVINRTPEGQESQEIFMATRHQEQEQSYEFEVQQRLSLLGAT